MECFDTEDMKGTEKTIERIKKMHSEWLEAIQGTILEDSGVDGFFEDMLFDLEKHWKELYEESPEAIEEARLDQEDRDSLKRWWNGQRL